MSRIMTRSMQTLAHWAVGLRALNDVRLVMQTEKQLVGQFPILWNPAASYATEVWDFDLRLATDRVSNLAVPNPRTGRHRGTRT